MAKFKKNPDDCVAFGKKSTHPLRQQLIDYSKNFNQTNLKKFIIKYYEGHQYWNLNLRKYIIEAHNYIEANVIIMDYFNLKLKSSGEDQYSTLLSILNDDFEENFDTDGNLIFDETTLDENDTLWLEKTDDDKNRQIVLRFQD